MPKFFFNIRQNGELIRDEEGIDLPTWDALKKQVEASARELVSERIKYGRPVSGLEFEVVDVTGATVITVPMTSVIQ